VPFSGLTHRQFQLLQMFPCYCNSTSIQKLSRGAAIPCVGSSKCPLPDYNRGRDITSWPWWEDGQGSVWMTCVQCLTLLLPSVSLSSSSWSTKVREKCSLLRVTSPTWSQEPFHAHWTRFMLMLCVLKVEWPLPCGLLFLFYTTQRFDHLWLILSTWK
jgi:hypothetical protein